MDLREVIARDSTATFNILADINSNVNGKNFNIVLNKTGSNIISSN
jgi:hypothetical protein